MVTPAKSILLFLLVAWQPLHAASRGWVAVKTSKQSSPTYKEVHDSAGWRYRLTSSERLSRWDGKKWLAITPADEPECPQAIAALGRGLVCVWSRSLSHESGELQVYRLSFHEGAKMRWFKHPKLQARFHFQTLYGPQLLKAGAAQLLLINQRELYLVKPDGKVSHLFAITPDKMQRLGPPQRYSDKTNELKVLDDKRGRYWFYSNVWSQGEEAYSLRGLLHWDGRELRHLTALSGLSLSKTAINTLARRDDEHLWLALGERGLFDLEVRTLKARPVTSPLPGAFRYVQQVTTLGSDLFVVAFARSHAVEDDVTARFGQLWRRRANQWQRLIDNLDLWVNDQTERPILATPSGVWTVAAEGGVWLAPPQGAPLFLDWRRGLPLQSVSQLVTQKDGSLLLSGWGAGQISVRIVNVEALRAQRPTARLSVFRPYLEPEQDRNGRIWTILALRHNALSQWSGTQWVHHKVPHGYKLSNAAELGFDRLGRVWILSDWRDGPVVLFNPSKRGSAAWQLFAHYRAALQAQLGAASPALPLFYEKGESERQPYQTPHIWMKRLAYCDIDDNLHYFDGKAWHRWTTAQIAPQSKVDDREVSPPFFNRTGVLCIWIGSNPRQLKGQSWRAARSDEEDPRFHEPRESENNAAIETAFPYEPGYSGPASARNHAGYHYVAFKGQLFKMTPEAVKPRLIAPLFEAHENHPFMNGRQFERAFFDRLGNVFFDQGNGEIALLFAGRDVPDTGATARLLSVDAYEINCTTNAKGNRWFVWRLNDGLWSAPQSLSKIQLNELPGGTHRLEVAAINRFLHRDNTPAALTLTVNLDPHEQIKNLIADLTSPDYTKREKAVQNLAKQPQRARPALEAAREKADADFRWWIDVALQTIEAAAK